MHFYWSHLEATNVYPIHFTLTAAQIISVFCAVQGKLIAHDLWNGCRFKTSVVSESRCFLKKRMIIWPLCVIASKPTWGTALCVYCFCPVGLIPPHVCLQPTAAMLIIWRLRWANLILWWRPSVGCCCSPGAKTVMLHRGHGMLKRVCSTKLTS